MGGRGAACCLAGGVDIGAVGRDPVCVVQDPNEIPADARLDAYDFILPEGSIARAPVEKRSEARLLVHHPDARVEHLSVSHLPSLLQPGDVLVVNDTRVLPARLFGRKLHANGETGARVEIVLLSSARLGRWTALVRPGRRLPPGTRVQLTTREGSDCGPTVVIGADCGDGARVIDLGADPERLLAQWGELPLPPYLGRAPVAADAERYQSVFGQEPGAVAAPTASLHFDPPLLDALRDRGVRIVTVTLHVGGGTFLPVRVDDLRAHHMHEEAFRVAPESAEALALALAEGRHILCVGTTSLRAVESWWRAGTPRDGRWSTTTIFLRPGDGPRGPWSLMTNFHLPRTTLLVLVASLIGRTQVLRLYDEAITRGYRFYSYGDATLLLRPRVLVAEGDGSVPTSAARVS